MNKRPPVLSGICIALMFVAMLLPFMVGQEHAGQMDVHLRNVLPSLGAVLVVAAFIRGERAVWAIAGLVLTGFYFGLHFVPAC